MCRNTNLESPELSPRNTNAAQAAWSLPPAPDTEVGIHLTQLQTSVTELLIQAPSTTRQEADSHPKASSLPCQGTPAKQRTCRDLPFQSLGAHKKPQGSRSGQSVAEQIIQHLTGTNLPPPSRSPEGKQSHSRSGRTSSWEQGSSSNPDGRHPHQVQKGKGFGSSCQPRFARRSHNTAFALPLTTLQQPSAQRGGSAWGGSGLIKPAQAVSADEPKAGQPTRALQRVHLSRASGSLQPPHQRSQELVPALITSFPEEAAGCRAVRGACGPLLAVTAPGSR